LRHIIAFLAFALLVLFLLWSPYPVESLKIIGAILGIAAFGWKLWDAETSYLYIDVTVNTDQNKAILVKTSMENKSPLKKKIDNALLLVGPETEDPIQTFNELNLFCSLGKKVRSTNEIACVQINSPVYDDAGRALIPLPFYYSENIVIGDEKLSYRAPIDISHLKANVTYSVRFFLCAVGRLHRSTHDAFLINVGKG
jgi:hypothetical protein